MFQQGFAKDREDAKLMGSFAYVCGIIFTFESIKLTMQEVYTYSDEELKKLGDAIVWTAILAAIHQDGVIQPSERTEAIKQTHIRAFSTEDYLRPIYKHLDDHFEANFDSYSASLKGTQEENETAVQKKIEDALEILPSIGPIFTKKFTADITDLYNRVFQADSTVFQFFLFPVISGHLQKFALKK